MYAQVASLTKSDAGNKCIVHYLTTDVPRHYRALTGIDLTDGSDMIQLPNGARVRYLELCHRAALWYNTSSWSQAARLG